MDKEIFKRHPLTVVVATLLALILIVVVFFNELILAGLGQRIVEKQDPVDACYIVVLQGGIPDRIAYGVDLYQQGYAGDILMVESKSFNNYELIKEHNLNLPSNVEINKEAALQLGANEKDITILPGKVDSTRQEAKAVREYAFEGSFAGLENKWEKEIERILLVTSEFHSKRAKLIFEDELESSEGKKIEIISTPSPYDPFCTEGWWQDRRQMRNLFMEYLKLFNFYTFGI